MPNVSKTSNAKMWNVKTSCDRTRLKRLTWCTIAHIEHKVRGYVRCFNCVLRRLPRTLAHWCDTVMIKGIKREHVYMTDHMMEVSCIKVPQFLRIIAYLVKGKIWCRRNVWIGNPTSWDWDILLLAHLHWFGVWWSLLSLVKDCITV